MTKCSSSCSSPRHIISISCSCLITQSHHTSCLVPCSLSASQADIIRTISILTGGNAAAQPEDADSNLSDASHIYSPGTPEQKRPRIEGWGHDLLGAAAAASSDHVDDDEPRGDIDHADEDDCGPPPLLSDDEDTGSRVASANAPDDDSDGDESTSIRLTCSRASGSGTESDSDSTESSSSSDSEPLAPHSNCSCILCSIAVVSCVQHFHKSVAG